MGLIYPGTRERVEFLARKLRAGELVAIPTETVYGLAADALNAQACRRIFKAKGRPSSDPLIVHVGSAEQAEEVAEVGKDAKKLMRAFWPGPLTLVLPKKEVVPPIVTAGRDSVAVRMPAHPLARALLKAAGRPLAAPSANPFGYVSPTTAEHVRAGLGKKIRHILDGGPCAVGVESTIVDLRKEGKPRILRPGKVTRAEIERVLRKRMGPSGAGATGEGREEAKAGMIAPGMLARHYAPRTRVVLHRKVTGPAIAAAGERDAWVLLRKDPAFAGKKNVFTWSPRAGLEAVAKNLFAVLRRLDGEGWRTIHVEEAPGEGLAEAINDRLRRAAARA